LLRVFRRWIRWSRYGHALNPNGVLPQSPALRQPNGPAFDTNALQVSSSARPVGRLCQAAREAESKGEVLGPVSGKNTRPRRAHPISSDVRTSEP
jgi:hypothetical protein